MIVYDLYIGNDFLRQEIIQFDLYPREQVELCWYPPREIGLAVEGAVPVDNGVVCYKMIFVHTSYNHSTGCFKYSLREFGNCK